MDSVQLSSSKNYKRIETNNANSAAVIARRSSNRSVSRNPVNYNETSDNESENENEALISPIFRRSSGGYVSHGIDSNGEKGKKQIFSPVLDLDVEGDDNESETIKAVSKKNLGKRSNPNHSGDDPDFHKIPSSRRRLS